MPVVDLLLQTCTGFGSRTTGFRLERQIMFRGTGFPCRGAGYGIVNFPVISTVYFNQGHKIIDLCLKCFLRPGQTRMRVDESCNSR